jgi:hypothetical protein
MIVPILARLYAMATADALGRVEKNAAWLAVYKPAGGHQLAVLLSQSFNRTSGHELSFRPARKLSAVIYHFEFQSVNTQPDRFAVRLRSAA